MCSPLISVIVPVYNAERYIEKCLDSIQNQTFSQIQVLVVDDGSTDLSGLICDTYAEKDGRFKVWHTENHGSFAARNLALSYVKTPFLTFVDADDWLELDMYKMLLKVLESTSADFVQCGIQNEGKYLQAKNKVDAGQKVIFEEETIYRGIYSEVVSQSVNDKLFRTTLFAGFSFAEEYYHSDAMGIMQLLQFCKKIVCIGERLYHYRTDNQSVTRGEKNLKHIYSMEALFVIYDKMAYKASDLADFFLCKEIPSMGRLIPPNHNISWRASLLHIRKMHSIFCKHWIRAKACDQYSKEPAHKRIYWNIYRYMPYFASIFIYLRLAIKTAKECEDKHDYKITSISISF